MASRGILCECRLSLTRSSRQISQHKSLPLSHGRMDYLFSRHGSYPISTLRPWILFALISEQRFSEKPENKIQRFNMERINFTAPDGYTEAIDGMKIPNMRNRSQKISAMLAPNVEPILEAHRKSCKDGKRMPKGKK